MILCCSYLYKYMFINICGIRIAWQIWVWTAQRNFQASRPDAHSATIFFAVLPSASNKQPWYKKWPSFQVLIESMQSSKKIKTLKVVTKWPISGFNIAPKWSSRASQVFTKCKYRASKMRAKKTWEEKCWHNGFQVALICSTTGHQVVNPLSPSGLHVVHVHVVQQCRPT